MKANNTAAIIKFLPSLSPISSCPKWYFVISWNLHATVHWSLTLHLQFVHPYPPRSPPSTQSTLDQKPTEQGSPCSSQLRHAAELSTPDSHLCSLLQLVHLPKNENKMGGKSRTCLLGGKYTQNRKVFCVNILMAKKNSLCAGLS